ncbi:MAG: NYN domain-containing protein [Candidatus Omnitrophica bacterium]|nr:NYN domain-containing protein [Candidatus Omnitrophota bacterium]
MEKENNYAFIDSQNLNLGIRDQGWILDFKRFRVYLHDKFKVNKAFLFIGFIPTNQGLYETLQEFGYILIFKPTLNLRYGKVKGNVDAELVLHAMKEINNYDKAVIVSGDGDFYCLIEYLEKHQKLSRIIVPNKEHYSSLLRRFIRQIVFMNFLKAKVEYTKKERH